MRLALRVALAVALLAIVVLVGFAVTLPSLVDRPDVRARIEAAAREATGRDVRFDGLAVGLLPPRVRVLNPSVAGARDGDPPLFTASEVSLRIALLPLLARQLVVDSLAVEGPRVRIVRAALQAADASSANAPAAPADAAAAGTSATGSAGPAPAGASPLQLAVRSFILRDGRAEVVDTTVDPPVTWTIEDLDAEARGTSPDAPIDLEVAAKLASGGALHVRGTATLKGVFDLDLKLDAIDVAAAKPYGRGAASTLAGNLGGTVRVRGVSSALEALDADLAVANADIAAGQIALRGPLRLKAQLAGAPDALSGHFEVDATAAEMEYHGGFKKPAGTPATVSGQLVRDSGGALGIDDLRIQVKNLDMKGTLRTGARTQLHLEGAPFAVAGWETLLPPLAGAALAGQLALGALDVATAPLDLRGAPTLQALSVALPGKPPIVVDGALALSGDAARTRDFTVRVAGQPFHVAADVASLAASPRYRVKVGANAVDAKALVNAFSARKDVFEGPLTLESDFAGPLGGGEPIVRTLSGNARVDVGRGRLRGVSLLQGAIDQLGAVGQAALAAGKLEGGKTLQRFYEDEFESIGGTFVVANARATTNDLKLVYRHYTVDLRGGLGLEDQAIDMTGKLTIDADVDAAVANHAAGGDATGAGGRVIPLARVTGTLSAPKVSVTAEAATAFLASYALGRRREKLESKIDEKLGKGAGRDVMNALDGLLGGKKKP